MEVQHFSTLNDGRFFADIDIGVSGKPEILQAELRYIKQGSIMNIHHTFVPEQLRGRGLAEKLTRTAFDYAKKHNMKIKPTCPYIEDTFLKKFPELKAMTVPVK
ncbi:MAG TPA: GNAT family N-acetyltransferase [archaeon]|nr:GNAT family N-acetyltransferase [archaeon]